MPPRPSVGLVTAKYALDLCTSDELVALANSLLDEGAYTHSVGELATVSSPVMSEVACLFTGALRELGFAIPQPKEAVRSLPRHYLWAVAEAVYPPREGVVRFYEECYRPLELARWEHRASHTERLAHVPGVRELVNLYYQYEDLEGYEGEYLSEEERRQRLAKLEQQALELATEWTRANGPASLDPSWLSANGNLALHLAQTIRDERRFLELPVLADALEEAGCAEESLLSHCRDPGGHAGRCWAIDFLLGERGV